MPARSGEGHSIPSRSAPQIQRARRPRARPLPLGEAKEHLVKAVELEPYFALPQVVLGQVNERLGDGKGAQAAYTNFLARSSQKESQRAFATTRLKEVTEILGTPPKP